MDANALVAAADLALLAWKRDNARTEPASA
jgi:hypothetical protein